MMEEDDFIYPVFTMRCFWESAKKYYTKKCEMAVNLPWRLVPGFSWIPRCHLGKGQQTYNELGLKHKKLSIRAFHYEGLRDAVRLKDKYKVGGRQSPKQYGGGRRLKRQKDYNGPHPEFAVPVLVEKGYL
jgi:hypothetical protein